MTRTNRRDFLHAAKLAAVSASLGMSGLGVSGLGAPVLAQAPAPNARLRVTVDESEGMKARPIAIPLFIGDDPQLAQQITQVVASNLHNCGYFKVIDPAAYIEQIRDINQMPNYPSWQRVGAEALIVGRITRGQDGRIQVDYRFWDIVLSRQLDNGGSVRIAQQAMRRLGHQVSDRFYERMLQDKGYFDTQVVFVDETGSKQKRIKRLAIMDQDGFGMKPLTDGRSLAITPRFNPTNSEICYLQYEGEQPRVFLMNTETGQREPVPVPGQSYGARFSADGQRLIFTVTEGATGSLVEMDLRSRQMRRITQPQSIDTGASYSPDGRALVFESDREGTQQLYILDLARGGAVTRLSRGDGRYSTPVWSPRGDYIAFTKQGGGEFLIGVMKVDGTGERMLSRGFHNEGPTWAPNGRVVMFFREERGQNPGPKLFSVDATGHNERNVPTPGFGSDPAWSPLRT
jgi:TolB protein